MANNIRKVLRNTSNKYLREYFEHIGCDLGVKWDEIKKETKIEPVFQAWAALPDKPRTTVEIDIESIESMAAVEGHWVIMDEARKQERGDQVREMIEERQNRYDSAVGTLVQFPAVWNKAVRFAHVDALSRTRYWITRKGLPKRLPSAEGQTIDLLGEALRSHFTASEGRGQRCVIEQHSRSEKSLYFFAYSDSFAEVATEIASEGGLKRTVHRPVFETVFVYESDRGVLSMYARGGERVYVPLQRAFVQIALGEEIADNGPPDPPFELNVLKDSKFTFPTDPEDGVIGAQVRRLRLVARGQPRRRVTFEADANGADDEIYRMMEAWLRPQMLSVGSVNVTSATIALRLDPRVPDRPSVLTFDVSFPNSSNIQSLRWDLRTLALKCVRRWGIDVS